MRLALTSLARCPEGPISLEALTEQVTVAAQRCHDHPGVWLHQTMMEDDGTWQFPGGEGRLTRHALDQLCRRLAVSDGGTVPAGYVARCPACLAAHNLNFWLADFWQKEQRVLVRAREKDSKHRIVRAILSDRYAVLDHQPLLESLRDLAPRYHLTIAAWALDDTRLTLRLLAHADHPASLSDPFRVGIHITNSEVGLGAVAFSALITRMVCANGLVVKVADLGGFHRRHLGRAGEDLPQTMEEALPQVLAAADEAGYRFARLCEEAAPWPVEGFVQRTAQRLELSREWVPQVVAQLEGDSMYDVVNAFTQVAQPFPVAERVRIETAMSQFLRVGGHPS